MTALKNKIDFALVFTVRNANPNGDPLDGNRPRTTYEGLGEISDVCLKRKIRNRWIDAGYPVFVQSDDRRAPGDNYRSLRGTRGQLSGSQGVSGGDQSSERRAEKEERKGWCTDRFL